MDNAVNSNLYLKKYNQLCGKKEALDAILRNKEKEMVSLSKLEENLECCLFTIRELAQKVQSELEYRLSEVVTTALNAVFPNIYEFNIEFKIKRGKTEAEITLVNKDGEKLDPLDEVSGGVVDVCSFALRIACMRLGNAENILILDEPFRCASKDKQASIGTMLKTISEKLNIQIIIVTHEGEYSHNADSIFEIEKITDTNDR